MSVKRINALKKKIRAENLDGMLIMHGDHLRYLTGYTGSNGLLLVTRKESLFFTDFRYADQAREQVTGARPEIVEKGDLITRMAEFEHLNEVNVRYGFASQYLTVDERNRLVHALPKAIMV